MSGRDLLVVGSGASSVHFALTALEEGHRVTMVDVGHRGAPAPLPGRGFPQLRSELEGFSDYLHGRELEGLLLPGETDKFYGLPPSREHVFRPEGGFGARGDGFEPLLSFARGGLAEAWTAGSYPYTDAELEAWPIGLEDLMDEYSTVAERIGISGAVDDLAPFFPVHRHLGEPVALDEHAEDLMAAYLRRRERLRTKGVHLGRSRVAVLAEDRSPRRGCSKTGRCLWGCPNDALWTPSLMLPRLLEHPAFTYIADHRVERLLLGAGGRVEGVEACAIAGGGVESFKAERVALGAGALGSAWILLRTLRAEGEATPSLTGLMDNRQVLVPFVNLSRVGRAHDPESYQYHQLSFGLEGETPFDYVHGQVTTLTTAVVHPLIASLPFALGRSVNAFRDLRGALGLVNLNFADTRREECGVALEGESLLVRYRSRADEAAAIEATTRRLRGVLDDLGCLAPRSMVEPRPMGASIHYCGLWPMSAEGGPRTATPSGECRALPGALLIDGLSFPSLPAKNLTFTLMANASRIARQVLH